jgi:hypothetical protein
MQLQQEKNIYKQNGRRQKRVTESTDSEAEYVPNSMQCSHNHEKKIEKW